MDTTRKIFYSVCVCVFLLVGSEVCAGISNSPHDIVSWYALPKSKTGICAYCHVPHSAKGDRLFPEQSSTQITEYGLVAGLCSKCHFDNTYLPYNEQVVANEIFITLDKVKNDSTMDSHPVKGTKTSTQSNALQDTKLDTVKALEWPWLAGWETYGATKPAVGDIECSTCHNPHQWNASAYGSTAQRKFLRAPVYASNGPVGRKNFCSWCHKNREDGRRGPGSGNMGTHPVADGTGGRARFGNCTTGSYYKDTTYMIKPFYDSAGLVTGDRKGRAVWDYSWAKNNNAPDFLGARSYDTNTIMCQSCHMPHGVMHSDDDVYYDTGIAELRVGPLLAINNATNWERTKPTYGAKIGGYGARSETVYSLPANHEQNLLCEWCHGMTPDLESNTESTAAFAHPVNSYPTIGAGKGTSDNMPSEDSHGFGKLHIKYPGAAWLKYRESSGIRNAANTQKLPAAVANPPLAPGNRDTGNYLICLSCHEAHNADTTNGYLLKKGSSGGNPTDKATFCDGCHKDVAMGTGTPGDAYFTDWTTHPSGITAKMKNTDGGAALPNRAKLRIFDSTNTSSGGYVSCWTCHKGHKGVEKPVLADYQTEFSQICVNCHCEGGDVATPKVTAPGDSKNANWAYGIGAVQTNANPSKYYKEGAWPAWWTNKTSGAPAAYAVGDSTRRGSHYVGQFTGTRPILTDGPTKGWLGERDEERETGKNLRSIKHYDTSTSEKDNWLETTRFIDTVWSTAQSGSGQKSHIGKIGTESVLICQSCHAVHNSAVGVADDSAVSRLLLASNYDSYMCRRCHVPEPRVENVKTKSHPMSKPILGTDFTYNTAVTDVLTGGKRLINTDSSHFAYNYATYAPNPGRPAAPANYPIWTGAEHRMTCDACHTAHNAQSKMGALITEGPDSAYLQAVVSNVSGNKVPKNSERDDKVTCDLCHKQGK